MKQETLKLPGGPTAGPDFTGKRSVHFFTETRAVRKAKAPSLRMYLLQVVGCGLNVL